MSDNNDTEDKRFRERLKRAAAAAAPIIAESERVLNEAQLAADLTEAQTERRRAAHKRMAPAIAEATQQFETEFDTTAADTALLNEAIELMRPGVAESSRLFEAALNSETDPEKH